MEQPISLSRQFQNGMVICRKYHKPDLLITITCNHNWPEIREHLLPGQAARDMPDIVAHVFKLKLYQLLKDLAKKEFFGFVFGILNVVEFQKRGLPHCHILLILHEHDRLRLL